MAAFRKYLEVGELSKPSVGRPLGRGTDLFFQVCEGRGSRVLLRTSMVRSLVRSPRECMETAADLAASPHAGDGYLPRNKKQHRLRTPTT